MIVFFISVQRVWYGRGYLFPIEEWRIFSVFSDGNEVMNIENRVRKFEKYGDG